MQIKKTINFDEEMVAQIEKLAKEAERDFSGQVRWIIKEWIQIKEK